MVLIEALTNKIRRIKEPNDMLLPVGERFYQLNGTENDIEILIGSLVAIKKNGPMSADVFAPMKLHKLDS